MGYEKRLRQIDNLLRIYTPENFEFSLNIRTLLTSAAT